MNPQEQWQSTTWTTFRAITAISTSGSSCISSNFFSDNIFCARGWTGHHTHFPNPVGQPECHAFNPQAAPFVPGQVSIQTMPEVMQDLHHAWHLTAFSWEGEPRSATIVTWFVDHADRDRRTCWYPRNIQLQEDFMQWEGTIRRTWRDQIQVGASGSTFSCTSRSSFSWS